MSVLFHYGVKGMKWGVRRDQAVLERLAGRRTRSTAATREERKAENRQAKQDWKDFKSKTTRKERRALSKQALTSRGEYIISEVLDSPDTKLVTIQPTPMSPPIMVTGKQFITHLGNGGAFDVKTAELYDLPGKKKGG